MSTKQPKIPPGPKPGPKTKTIAVKLPLKTYDRFLLLAGAEGLNRSDLGRVAVEELLERRMPIAQSRKQKSQRSTKTQNPKAA